MEFTGAALRRSLPSAPPAVARGRRRRRPARVACVGGKFAEEGHLRYYEAAPPRKAVEAVARDLAKLRAMGLAAGDSAKEKVLSEATDLLMQELSQMKDEEYKMKKAEKEEKAAMKALKKQQKEMKKAAAAAAAMNCEDESSESSESDCEEEQLMQIGQGMAISVAVAEAVASGISTVSTMECEKAAMKAMKKLEKEQKKAAKKAMKMKKEAKKKAMAELNGCRDEDSSCSSESSESECEGEVVRMSRCATITAPETPSPSTVFPIIVPQIPASVEPEPSQDVRISSELATATQFSSIAVVEKPTANRIEVCMGGKCKKAGSLALLQEFEKNLGTGVAVGCKCLGKCGLGPNVRLRSEDSKDGSAKRNPLCIGVGLEDVGTIVAALHGDSDLGMSPT
ncbi:hypothetical protein ACP70R_041224 [Stipagrostis hirtigluma subsp. patula]